MDAHHAKSVRPQLLSAGGGEQDVAGDSGSIGSAMDKEEAADDLGDELIAEIIEEGMEAARNPRTARRPDAPTRAMVLAHELHHAEYRVWCKHCVAGKGVSHAHKH